MFLFIATIFIAEIIITLTLIAYIIKADRAIIKLKNDLISIRPSLKTALKNARDGITVLKDKQELFFKFLEKKRNQCMLNAIKTILIYLLLFIFKGKCKKASAICQGILLVKDVWDRVSV